VGHSLLHEDDALVADVARIDQVGAMEDEVDAAALAADVDWKIMVAQIVEAAPTELVAADRVFERADVPENLEIEVPVVRREDVRVLRELPGDLVHLRRLIDRSADEQDLLSPRLRVTHARSSSILGSIGSIARETAG